MGSHRPYGTGETAIPDSLDRKAEAAGGRHWFGPSGVSDAERARIVDAYRDALGRVDERVRRLVDAVEADAADPIVAITADHGEELGEDGYFYHQGFRRRVADTLVRVPVVLRGVEPAGDRCSLLDLAPTLASAVDLDVPEEWQGNDLRETTTDQALTVAPWHDTATVAWQDFERKLVARDASVSVRTGEERVAVAGADVSGDVERQLRDLGYTDAG
jgi:arylsulfatase A-like enzyme